LSISIYLDSNASNDAFLCWLHCLTPCSCFFCRLAICIMQASICKMETDWFIANLVCYGSISDGHYTHLDAVDWGFKDIEFYLILSCVGEDIGFKTVPWAFSFKL
jgi:hypothetical protein